MLKSLNITTQWFENLHYVSFFVSTWQNSCRGCVILTHFFPDFIRLTWHKSFQNAFARSAIWALVKNRRKLLCIFSKCKYWEFASHFALLFIIMSWDISRTTYNCAMCITYSSKRGFHSRPNGLCISYRQLGWKSCKEDESCKSQQQQRQLSKLSLVVYLHFCCTILMWLPFSFRKE